MNQKTATRPGTTTIRIGLALAAMGLVIVMVVVSGGGDPRALWMVLLGLVVAAVGFGRRVLAALEDKPRTSDDLRVNGTHAE